MVVANDFVNIDACDAIAGWNVWNVDSTAAALNAVEFLEGTGSIELGKAGVASNQFGLWKNVTFVVNNRQILVLFVCIRSMAARNVITKARVRLYDQINQGGNWVEYDFLLSPPGTPYKWWDHVQRGWNTWRVRMIAVASTFVYDQRSGVNPGTTIRSVAIYFETGAAADLVAQGDVLMDYWHFGRTITVTGNETMPNIVAHDIANNIGCVRREGDFAWFNVGCQIQVGDGIAATSLPLHYATYYPYSIRVLPRTCWYWGYTDHAIFRVMNNATLTSGIHHGTTHRPYQAGLFSCNIRDYSYGYLIYPEVGSIVNLYGTAFINLDPQYYNLGVRDGEVWHCFFGTQVSLGLYGATDLYQTKKISYGTGLNLYVAGATIDGFHNTTYHPSYGGIQATSTLAASAVAENCILRECSNDTYCYGLAAGVQLILRDLDSDHEPLITRWYATAGNPMTGEKVLQDYRIPFHIVDLNGNPIAGLTIDMYDAFGVLQDTGVTDALGEYTTAACPHRGYGCDPGVVYPYAGSLSTTVEYSPYTIVVRGGGWQTSIFEANLRDLWLHGSVRKHTRVVDLIMVDDETALNLDEENPESETFTQL